MINPIKYLFSLFKQKEKIEELENSIETLSESYTKVHDKNIELLNKIDELKEEIGDEKDE